MDGKEDGRRLQPPGEGRFLSLSLSLCLCLSLSLSIFHFPFPILRFSFFGISDFVFSAIPIFDFIFSADRIFRFSFFPFPILYSSISAAFSTISPSLVLEFLPGRFFSLRDLR